MLTRIKQQSNLKVCVHVCDEDVSGVFAPPPNHPWTFSVFSVITTRTSVCSGRQILPVSLSFFPISHEREKKLVFLYTVQSVIQRAPVAVEGTCCTDCIVALCRFAIQEFFAI